MVGRTWYGNTKEAHCFLAQVQADAAARFPSCEDCSCGHLVEGTCGEQICSEKTLGLPFVAADSGAAQRQWRCKAACWDQARAPMLSELLGPQFAKRFLAPAENRVLLNRFSLSADWRRISNRFAKWMSWTFLAMSPKSAAPEFF